MSTNPNTPVSEEDAWYHGDIGKEEATAILIDDGIEGTFLVRESTSRPGDYAISVIFCDEVHHFQIMRHDGDAFFSIANENRVIHGLDELIKFYQSPDNGYILLGRPKVKSMPPPDCRRHGRTNLLHRATKEGEVQIVREMVRCGHRNIDAKNECGQTAAHIAAINGHADILQMLIETGANVNAKDSNSQTPLHYACISNHPKTVFKLLTFGQANPQTRRQDDGWVPLHEAAFRGHKECVAVLLQCKAPLRPRTVDGKFPIHLAIENCRSETVKFIREFRPDPPVTNRDDWYHSVLGRKEAVTLLQQCQLAHDDDGKTCYFLVRRSNRSVNNSKTYVLTLQFQGRPSHYEIGQKDAYFFIDNGPFLDSLEDIIEHYSRWSDGLPARLQIPVCPTKSYASPQNKSGSPPPPLPKRIPLPSSNGLRLNSLPNDLSSLRISPTPVNNNFIGGSSFTSLATGYPKDNIPSENIELGALLGNGEYGDVYEGTFTNLDGSVIKVAVKTLREDIESYSKEELLREGRVMMNLEHENIVKFIGISWHPNICMVQELMKLGSLHSYLKNNESDKSAVLNIPLWALQVARGMIYLEHKEVVHRDLALRNILLADIDTAKISDFGLSRVLGAGKDYYAASQGGRWPIKWYAPECCSYGTFSHKSDVWSFGITLWEMYSFGDVPYGSEIPGSKVLDMVEEGHRLEKPELCPLDVYEIMRKCWSKEPENRPSFNELSDFFTRRVKLETSC